MERYLAHHGIKGQKWGIRRYQNPDGTLTEEGKRKLAYRVGESRLRRRVKHAGKVANRSFSRVTIKNQLKGSDAQKLKQQTQDVLTNDERIYKIGRQTIWRRVGAISAGTVTAGATIVGALAASAPPLAALAAIPVGATAWYYGMSRR